MNNLFDDTLLLQSMNMAICPVDRIIFKAVPSRLKTGKRGKYCKRKCYKIAKAGTQPAPRKVIVCANCGKPKTVREKQDTLYCSKNCKATIENKKRNPKRDIKGRFIKG